MAQSSGMSRLYSPILVLTICSVCQAWFVTGPMPVFFDSTNNLHRSIDYHPEQPQRINICVEALQNYSASEGNYNRLELVDVAESPQTETSTATTTHRPFTQEELDHARAMLVNTHSESLVSNTEDRCRSARERRLAEGRNPLGFVGYIDDDTYLTTESYDVCLRATAAWIRAVDCAIETGGAMALTRPPGHHATKGLSNGFCVFNFAAAAAMHALQRFPSLKISMFDWDVHYGQGVAHIIEKQPRARYVSIHQTPAFPYLGESCQLQGKHQNVLPIPIQADTTWTCGYEQAFFDVAIPFLKDEEWSPDLVIVCAGYDALSSDELASVGLVSKDYARMTREIMDRLRDSRSSTTGKRSGIMFGLEGGYELRIGAAGGNLADAVLDTVRTMVE